MRLPKLSTLILIASICGTGVGVTALLLNYEKTRRVNGSSFVLCALDILKAEPEAIKMLGDKVEVGRGSLGDGWAKLEPLSVRIKVPIKGQHDYAHLWVYARRQNTDELFKLYRLEATFGKLAGKRLVLLNSQSDGDPFTDVDGNVVSSKHSYNEENSRDKKSKPGLLRSREEFIEEMKRWQPKR